MNTETFERLLKQAVPDGKTIREIRIRTEKPVMILLESGENLLFSDGTCGKTESYGKKKMGALEIREERSSCRPGADPRDSGDLFQTFAERLRAGDQPGIPHDLRGTPCGNRRESGGGGRTCEDGPGSLIFKYPCCP